MGRTASAELFSDTDSSTLVFPFFAFLLSETRWVNWVSHFDYSRDYAIIQKVSARFHLTPFINTAGMVNQEKSFQRSAVSDQLKI